MNTEKPSTNQLDSAALAIRLLKKLRDVVAKGELSKEDVVGIINCSIDEINAKGLQEYLNSFNKSL